jgi:hypothetical protein
MRFPHFVTLPGLSSAPWHKTERDEGSAVSLKAILFTLGCLVAWFVLLPLLLIAGGAALFAYAIFAELAAFVTGHRSKTLDTSVARDIARRMCGGYGVQVRRTDAYPPRRVLVHPIGNARRRGDRPVRS